RRGARGGEEREGSRRPVSQGRRTEASSGAIQPGDDVPGWPRCAEGREGSHPLVPAGRREEFHPGSGCPPPPEGSQTGEVIPHRGRTPRSSSIWPLRTLQVLVRPTHPPRRLRSVLSWSLRTLLVGHPRFDCLLVQVD